ncbi:MULTISPECIES: hypothetical protein [Kitasatospora]|uniref:Secreted protein n=2 Tax=Kitasatospora TaxID=2063 RepID=A0ABT1IYV3_9ACTN|nr:hypothetical protein [Kitasatospora paracochleata]MCP2310124.1 hypothetical protein [Kitasatospora paracochleata]
MLRKKFAVLALLIAAAAVAPAAVSAAPALADGPKNEKEATVCSKLLGSVLPGLVPTKTVCKVNVDNHGGGTNVTGPGVGKMFD